MSRSIPNPAHNQRRAAADKWANLSGLLSRPGFELHRLDLASGELDPLVGGAAAVLHLAARPGVRSSFGPGFSGYLHDNVLGTQRLLEACVRAEVPRVLFASSSSVYGDAPTYPVTEESRTRPVSPYGVTKLAAEQLCQAYAGLAGPAMRVAMLAMTAPVEVEAVNIGGGRRVSLGEALELVGQATGRRLRIERRPLPLTRPGTGAAAGHGDGPGGRCAARWRRWRRPAPGRC